MVPSAASLCPLQGAACCLYHVPITVLPVQYGYVACYTTLVNGNRFALRRTYGYHGKRRTVPDPRGGGRAACAAQHERCYGKAAAL